MNLSKVDKTEKKSTNEAAFLSKMKGGSNNPLAKEGNKFSEPQNWKAT